MNKFLILSFVVVLLLPLVADGQSPSAAPKPVPPFLSPVPDNSSCTIAVSHLDSPAKPPPGHRLINQLVITKSAATRELLSVYTDGSRSEVWFSQGYRIEQLPGHHEVMITPLPRGNDSASIDFPNLQWLALDNYVDIENQKDKTCWHFKTQVQLKEQNLIFDYSAYIDCKTKRPVVWEFGTTHYELVSISPAMLPTMPPDFAAALKTYQDAAALPNSYRK